MGQPITSIDGITAEWLTARLRANGVLPKGKVINVVAGDVRPSFASAVYRLKVNYSGDAPNSAPQKLFLKISNPSLAPGEYDPEQMNKEYVFYHTVSPSMTLPFTIPCYDTAFDPGTGASHILLKDVSNTHITCTSPSFRSNCEQAIDCLAQLHAYWWDHPLLGQEVGQFPTTEERRDEWANAESSTTAFITAMGAQIPQSWRSIYEKVLPALPGLYARHAAGRNLTLVHGDAHLGNFLFPIDPNCTGTYLIDWQFWHPTIGGTDLAFMMAAEWETETRRSLETDLIRRYHMGLMKKGIQNYTWHDCWYDYRLSVILVSIFIPVWRWSLFHWELDYPALQRGMTAFEDLDCFELIQ